MASMTILPVIAPFNYKGGVGKTLTGRVLGQTLAEMPEFNRGKPVLFIDMDPQGNTSKRWRALRPYPDGTMLPIDHPALADEEDRTSSVCDVWLEILTNSKNVLPVPYETSHPLIHVVPAHEVLMAKAMRLDEATALKLGTNLCNWLRSPEMAEKYCCAIIDTQPSKTNLVDAALRVATHAYIPFIPEPQSVEGVYSMISYLVQKRDLRGTDVSLEFLGLLPNQVRKTSLHSSQMKALQKNKEFVKHLLPVKLTQRTAYAETDDYRTRPETVTIAKGSNIEVEAKRFVKLIVNRLTEGGY